MKKILIALLIATSIKANINKQLIDGIQANDLDQIVYAIENGANVNYISKTDVKTKKTPIIYAALKPNPSFEVISILINYGADISHKLKKKSIIELVVANTDKQHEDESLKIIKMLLKTRLHKAKKLAKKNNLNKIKKYLEFKILNGKNQKEPTIIYPDVTPIREDQRPTEPTIIYPDATPVREDQRDSNIIYPSGDKLISY